MAYVLKDRCLSVTTTTGTGTLTLGSAVAGHQGISAVGDGNSGTFTVYEVDGSGVPDGNWEVFVGTYTASGTTLSRQYVLASSNSGSAVDFGAGDKYVALVSDASVALPPVAICDFRLTLESGVPVSTTDQADKTTLYVTPYRGNRIALYNGYSWEIKTSPQLSITNSSIYDTYGYDLFAYNNSGTVAIEALAWTNLSTRATALTTQDGVTVKSGDATRRYLGSFAVTYDAGGNLFQDTAARRLVWNAQNRVRRRLRYAMPTQSWTYDTASWREWNDNGPTQHCMCMIGQNVEELEMHASLACAVTADTGNIAVGIGINSTSTNSAQRFGAQIGSGGIEQLEAHYVGHPAIGVNEIWGLELGTGDGKTIYWYGQLGSGATWQHGLLGTGWF